ncbi:uncharacterized protein LOC116005821 [Ipomoea triloba]|uniref:uncharacterized protein LOC116005821 n=1 Tax=Ipomoea triloba TaxID=35885 RepID=UPI00125E8126|nr:uncharacterized protein LOC116005821 [Ipomoea triloba]
MDVGALELSCAVLSLDEEDAGGLDAPITDQASGSVIYFELVGRFLTQRAIKFEHMQQVMASVWQPVMGVRIVSLEDNLFVFQFPHRRDMQRVIDEGPWSFENNTLVCKLVPPSVRPEAVVLDSIDYWVQIHDLPTMFTSAEFIEQIGNYVGVFKFADPNNFGGTWRSFIRVRISLHLSEPLKRRMKLRMRDGTFQWILFKYERLTTFCFCCGLIGHSERFCRKVYEQGIEPKDYPYGAWLRAGVRRPPKPVGAKWLLADLPNTPSCVPSTPAIPSSQSGQVEEGVVLHGDLKRSREGDCEEA